MIRSAYIFLLLITPLFSLAQTGDNGIRNEFALSLNPSHSHLVSYAIVQVKNGNIVGSMPLSENDFMRQASGESISPANPERKNLFIEHQVDSCWVLYDSIYYSYGKKKYVGYDCIPLNLLWKLKYKAHPSKYDDTGWSDGYYAPDSQQMAYLQKAYGIIMINDYIYGEKLWRLLREIQIPEWQRFYDAGAGSLDRDRYLNSQEGGSEEGSEEGNDEGTREEDE